MFKLGGELGWSEEMRDDPVGQNAFFLMASSNIKTFELDSKLSFNDVLDNIALYYVIKKEFSGIMENYK